MSEQTQTTLPDKSSFGTTCSGCGTCCANEICALGREIYPNAVTPCPGLIYFESRLWCKFVVAEELAKLEPEIAQALGIGQGCCSDDWGSRRQHTGLWTSG